MLIRRWLSLMILIVPAAIEAGGGEGPAIAAQRPLTTKRSLVETDGPPAVLPSGWRRTTRGWERAELWPLSSSLAAAGKSPLASRAATTRPQSINDWIHWGRCRELTWARIGSSWVRGVHPLALACMLVGTAVVITRLSEPQPNRTRGGRGSTTARMSR